MFVAGDTIYVPVKRSAIANGDWGGMSSGMGAGRDHASSLRAEAAEQGGAGVGGSHRPLVGNSAGGSTDAGFVMMAGSVVSPASAEDLISPIGNGGGEGMSNMAAGFSMGMGTMIQPPSATVYQNSSTQERYPFPANLKPQEMAA